MIRRLVFACAALLGCAMVIAATAGPAAAQADRPGKSAPKSKQSSPITTPIVFYAAKGQPDACGPGCSEWIAAEGQFDVGAPQRLRTFLARHSASTARTDAPSDGRKLPIFFHSSGGLQDQAIAIGRLLREREMTAGVSRTIPAGCVGASDEACRALKQSGKKLDAELRSVASCNSACVYALVGGKARQVPPGARLGVHSGRLIQVRPDGRVEFVSHSSSPAGDKARFAEMNAKLQRYLREMRMDSGLFELASRIPHEQIHYLSRDEIVRFGNRPARVSGIALDGHGSAAATVFDLQIRGRSQGGRAQGIPHQRHSSRVRGLRPGRDRLSSRLGLGRNRRGKIDQICTRQPQPRVRRKGVDCEDRCARHRRLVRYALRIRAVGVFRGGGRARQHRRHRDRSDGPGDTVAHHQAVHRRIVEGARRTAKNLPVTASKFS
jgi:hypothetical protein